MGSAGESRRIWTAPALIAIVTLISLIGALITEEGIWDALAALILFLALAYAVGLGLSRSERHSKRRS